MSEFLCNLIILGAAKSGTSSLHALLGEHPRILMSGPKEPQFFSFDDLYQKGAESHNQIFDKENDYDYYGESSQSYFVHEHAIDRVEKNLDDPKIILLLRHPVERLLSHYRWRYKHAVEDRPLLQAIREGGTDTSYEYDPGFGMYAERGGGYIAFSQYSTYVPFWKDRFGEENVLLLRTQDLKENQQRVATRCFVFLDLPDYSVESTVRRHKTSESTVNFGHLPWYYRWPLSSIPERLRRNRVYGFVRNRVLKASTPTPPASFSEHQREKIASRLRPDIDFFNQIGSV
jgi:hypothetical protein